MLAENLTNEIGAAGKVRFLKNIAGLWLLQECRRAWMEEGAEYSYEELAGLAAAAKPFTATIDPDAFLEPGEMPRKIADYCRKTRPGAAANPRRVRAHYSGEPGAAVPPRGGEPGDAGRAADRGDPYCGRRIAERAAQPVRGRLHGTPVVAGPSEATAIGNVLIQAMGAGELANLDEVRAVVRSSFPLITVEAQPSGAWDRAYQRYRKLVGLD